MKKVLWLWMGIIAFAACRQKYVTEVSSSGKGLLVVEGNIILGPSAQTKIILTRTRELYDVTPTYELKAKVNIVAENGAVFPLTEGTKGQYISAPLNLTVGTKYRLQVTTSAGREYFSDYVSGETTLPIDNLTWKKLDNGGVVISVNSRIITGQNRYYQWRTEETWQFVSPYISRYKFQRNSRGEIVNIALVFANGAFDSSIYTCWRTENSYALLLANSENFSGNQLSEPVAYIAPNAEKLSIRYSINVIQSTISKEGYQFYSTLKKSTEQLGTIFDPQPALIQGNIHATADSKELVLGFISATQESSRRIFITSTDVGGWQYFPYCEKYAALATELGSYEKSWPIDKTDSVIMVRDTCVNCLLKGVNVKPSFW